jgi:hypothetical protein
MAFWADFHLRNVSNERDMPFREQNEQYQLLLCHIIWLKRVAF